MSVYPGGKMLFNGIFSILDATEGDIYIGVIFSIGLTINFL